MTAALPFRRFRSAALGGAPNRKVVFQNITLDDPDVETLEYLKGKGADIIFQTIPEDTPMKLDDILKRYK